MMLCRRAKQAKKLNFGSIGQYFFSAFSLNAELVRICFDGKLPYLTLESSPVLHMHAADPNVRTPTLKIPIWRKFRETSEGKST